MFLFPLKALFYQLYLLQLENYSLRRFVRASLQSFGRKNAPPRRGLVWTLKLKIVFVLGIVLQFFTAYVLGRAAAGLFGAETPAAQLFEVIFLYALCYVDFIFFAAAAALLLPFDIFMKQRIIARARTKIAGHKKLKVIGITGSYGKTTMKETLAAILSGKFGVLKTPESVNTPVGIARLILEKLNERTEIFIVEMGAYHRGDIAALCSIAPPDIAILTGINESHLERFGSIENTIAAKFEIVEHAKEGALAALNADDGRVRGSYEKYIGKHEVLLYSAKNDPRSLCRILRKDFFEDGSGAAFSLICGSTQYDLKTSLLGEYIAGTIAAAVLVSERLGMSVREIEAGVALVKPVPHRLEMRRVSGDIFIIDDSYNGNPEGVREAIAALARFVKRRKVYITPGLVEMGERAREVHRDIGRQLSAVVDVVLLTDNSVTGFVREGLEEAGFAKENIKMFPSAKEAHAALPALLLPGDVVLFQNDWPEGYI